MKKGLGIRPGDAQRHLPEDQVTEWILDSSGELDEEGRPLPRKRIVCKGRKPKALAQRRSWLAQLVADQQGTDLAPVTSRKRALTPAPSEERAPATSVRPVAASRRSDRILADFVRKEYHTFSLQKHDETTTPARMALLEKRILPVVGHLTLEEANTFDTVNLLRGSLDPIMFRGKLLKDNTKNQALLAFSHVLTAATALAMLPNKVRIGLYREKRIAPGQMLIKAYGFDCGISRHKRLPEDEVRRLFKACDTAYDFVLVGMGLFLACRPAEMPARLWSDVNWKEKRMTIWSQVAWNKATKTYYIKNYTKNGVGGSLMMSDELVAALKELRQHSTREYILTPNDFELYPFLTKPALRHRFKILAKRAGLARTTYMHGLRHTFCCQHADNGLPPHEIQILARHKSIKTTYEYIDPSTERLKRAVLEAGSFSKYTQPLIEPYVEPLVESLPSPTSADIEVSAPRANGRPWGADEAPTDLLDTKQAAKILGVTVGGLENMRAQGRGPKHIYVGRLPRYQRSDLLAGTVDLHPGQVKEAKRLKKPSKH